MRRSLLKRIDRLEALYAAPKLICSPIVMLVDGELQTTLAPDERVVEDWFRDCGAIVWARQRVTTEADDRGRRCAPGGYLLDVLEAFHNVCPWREKTGVCQMCQGTTVGNEECKPKSGVAT